MLDEKWYLYIRLSLIIALLVSIHFHFNQFRVEYEIAVCLLRMEHSFPNDLFWSWTRQLSHANTLSSFDPWRSISNVWNEWCFQVMTTLAVYVYLSVDCKCTVTVKNSIVYFHVIWHIHTPNDLDRLVDTGNYVGCSKPTYCTVCSSLSEENLSEIWKESFS